MALALDAQQAVGEPCKERSRLRQLMGLFQQCRDQTHEGAGNGLREQPHAVMLAGDQQAVSGVVIAFPGRKREEHDIMPEGPNMHGTRL